MLVGICEGCDKVINSGSDRDYYMLTESIWFSIADKEDQLCMNCCENRLGHKLRKDEIYECPVTRDNSYTNNILNE